MNTHRLLLLPCALISCVTLVSSWQYFVSILDRPLYNSAREPLETHTEYTFGDCNNRDNVLYMHVRLDHYQVLGKLIVRGWINIQRIPRCIILRAKSYDVDRFRTTAYPFQICVPRITYCHTHRRYKYFYYEWYIPFEYIGGMDWDIYFLGSPNLDWQ